MRRADARWTGTAGASDRRRGDAFRTAPASPSRKWANLPDRKLFREMRYFLPIGNISAVPHPRTGLCRARTSELRLLPTVGGHHDCRACALLSISEKNAICGRTVSRNAGRACFLDRKLSNRITPRKFGLLALYEAFFTCDRKFHLSCDFRLNPIAKVAQVVGCDESRSVVESEHFIQVALSVD